MVYFAAFLFVVANLTVGIALSSVARIETAERLHRFGRVDDAQQSRRLQPARSTDVLVQHRGNAEYLDGILGCHSLAIGSASQ